MENKVQQSKVFEILGEEVVKARVAQETAQALSERLQKLLIENAELKEANKDVKKSV